jgi:glycosyltransferase involved in cell wall biosynthesis
MISCLTITQPGRLPELARAIACFRSQTLSERELVIVHDADATFHGAIEQLVGRDSDHRMFQLHQVSTTGRTLGELRNLAVTLARYPVVAQWDDDDLYHPQRLEIQYAYLKIQGADFCFLTDQLHLFAAERLLFWDDWNVEAYPGNLIQGTLVGYRRLIGQYPALGRGEDTPLVLELVQRGCKIAALRGMGWVYIYVYTGKNVWDRQHHMAISAWKHLRGNRLKTRIASLEARLREYRPGFGSVRMPCEDGSLTLDVGQP